MRFQTPVFQPVGSVLSAQGNAVGNGVGMFIGPEGSFTVPRSQHLCEGGSVLHVGEAERPLSGPNRG